MRAVLDGTVIAESDDVIRLEGSIYFPRSSVKPGALVPTKLHTPCYWKGLARYHDVEAGGSRARYAAWSYEHPLPWIRRIRKHVAFTGAVEVVE